MAGRPPRKGAKKGAPKSRSGANKRAARTASTRGDAGKSHYLQRGNDRYDRHDAYYRRAKAEGYLARSVYKLEELDLQFKIIRPGDIVLDLGSAPGSWLQYAERKVAAKGGRLVGIDLLEVKLSFGDHVHVIQGDVFEATAAELLPPPAKGRPEPKDPARPFDVVMSDMAPNTTGNKFVDQARSAGLCERALDLAEHMLRPGGRFVVKMFEGGDTAGFLKACRALFGTVKVKRPKGVRVGSKETYIVGLDRRPLPDANDDEGDTP